MTADLSNKIVVVGGGISGSAAAFHLSRLGYPVTVLEREAKPHHKVCGEYLSGETLPYLREIGVFPETMGAACIQRLSVHSQNFAASALLPEPSWGLSRYRLDESLLLKAEQSGAEVRRGESVTDIRLKDSVFSLQTSDQKIKTTKLFLASGKHEVKSFSFRQGRENQAIGFKIHLKFSSKIREKMKGEISLFFYAGGYAGLCAIEEDYFNFCFIIDQEIYKKVGGDFSSVLNYLRMQNKKLRKLLEDACFEWAKPLAVAHVPYGYLHSPSKKKEDSLFLLGDQFTVIPSFTGSGMAIALLSAKLAAFDYHDTQRDAKNSEYHEKCYRLLQSRMKFSYPIHRFFRSNVLADLGILSAKCFRQMIPFLLRKTRVPFL